MSNGFVAVDFLDSVSKSRRPANKAVGSAGIAIEDADAFPCLAAILTTLPKGAVKGAKFGRVAMFLYNGKLTLCVTIPASRTVCFYTADSFADAISRLEGAIAGGKVDWREDDGNGRK